MPVPVVAQVPVAADLVVPIVALVPVADNLVPVVAPAGAVALVPVLG